MKRSLWGWAFVASFLVLAPPVGAQEKPAQAIAFPDPKLPVFGLPWFKEDSPLLCRLPARLKKTFTPKVWELARCPSGGRIRFRTNSRKLTLTAKCESDYTMYHITSIGQNGFDLYVDGFYQGSTQAVGPDRKEIGEWDLGPAGVDKEVTIYMPLYKAATIQEIDLDEKAEVNPPRSFAQPHPVVYYGTSITQGGCASNPGMSYAAILGRRLDCDFVNLGFSGNGNGDIAVAKAITELQPSAIVLDYWANVSAEQMGKTLSSFVKILREKFPEVPIFVITPYYTITGINQELKKSEVDLVTARQKKGDAHIQWIDGETMISRKTAYALVDGIHCNTLGFKLMADQLEKPLRKVILPKGRGR